MIHKEVQQVSLEHCKSVSNLVGLIKSILQQEFLVAKIGFATAESGHSKARVTNQASTRPRPHSLGKLNSYGEVLSDGLHGVPHHHLRCPRTTARVFHASSAALPRFFVSAKSDLLIQHKGENALLFVRRKR